MGDFVLVPSRYEHELVPWLKRVAPGFAASDECLSNADCEDLPGVMLAAYAAYLLRLANSGAPGLDEGMAALNELARWSDTGVGEALRDEVFEVLRDGSPGEARVRDLMSADLRATYET